MKIRMLIYYRQYADRFWATYVNVDKNIIIKIKDDLYVEYYDRALILPKITEYFFNPKNIRKISPMFSNYIRCYDTTYKFIKEMNGK